MNESRHVCREDAGDGALAPGKDIRPEGFEESFFQRVFEKANVRAMSVEEYSEYHKDMTTELDRCTQLYARPASKESHPQKSVS